MVRIAQKRVSQYLERMDNGSTTTDRGRALEELVCYLFEKMPGITVTTRNRVNVFRSEEIDVAFWNEQSPNGLHFLPNIILIECKNWSTPIGSSEVSWFDTKLRNRGLDFGILVTVSGITGNAEDQSSAHRILATALTDKRRILVITRNEIENFNDTSQVIRLLKEKLCDLCLEQTSFL